MSLSLRTLSVMAVVTSSALASSGGTLFQQTAAPGSLLLQVASQDFPDATQFTIAAADDFAVPGGPGWHINELSTSFTTGGSTGDPLGIRWTIWADNGPGGVPGDSVLTLEGGNYNPLTGDAQLDLAGAGQDFDLAPGAYWFTAQIIGGIGTFGQEFVLGSQEGAGSSNFHWNNPGGGFGLPSGWIDANGTLNPDTDAPWSDVTNLAFRVGGSIVPEPATIGLLVLGSACMLRRRR